MNRLAGAERGSLYVELITVAPFFVALWLLAIYGFNFYVAGVGNQRAVRACAWQHAASGCRDSCAETAGASPSLGGHRRVDDGLLRVAAGGGFEIVAGHLPFLAGTLASLHGDRFSVTGKRHVERPRQFGGTVKTEASFTTMCNTPTREWHLPAVFKLTCETLGTFCP
jgi:hypothetical protein